MDDKDKPKLVENVVEFPGETTLDSNADKVLEAAIGNLESVMIIGTTHQDNIYIDSSHEDVANLNLWLDLTKKRIMELASEEDM